MAMPEEQRPVTRYSFGSALDALSFTASKIGAVIEAAPLFWPLREWSAGVAAQAPRRDYIEQMRALYKAFLEHWAYVRDPFGVELLASTPEAVWDIVINRAAKTRKGAGDCDDCTAALGSMARCCGFDAMIRTVGVKSQNYPDHVHIVVDMQEQGYLPMDPVVEPKRNGFGYWPRGFKDWLWTTKGVLVWSSTSPEEQIANISGVTVKGV